MMSDVIEIELWDTDRAFVLILDNRGMVYSTQAGGMQCAHPSAKGFLVPVGLDHTSCVTDEWGVFGLEEISRQLGALRDFNGAAIGCDRVTARYGGLHCGEAWLPVSIEGGPLDGRAAILTWPNSD